MEFLAGVHLSCFLLSYLGAFGAEISRVLRRETQFGRILAVVFAAAGMLAHTIYLFRRSVLSGLPPLVGSSHDWLLVLAWLVGCIYLLLVWTRANLAIGLFFLPVIIALVVMSLQLEDTAEETMRETAAHRWSMLHASTLVIGMGTVAAATVSAIMYLLHYQKLRGRSSFLHRLQLPNLEQLTKLNRWLVVATFLMLTIGLMTGFILVAIDQDSSSAEFHWSDPIVSGTIVTWFIMVAALVWLLKKKQQTGRQVAQLTLMAGGFLLLTVFGLMLASGGVHSSPEKSDAESSANVPQESGASG